jgi:hypothetical protein
MNYLKLNSNEFFLTMEVQEVTGLGLPSWSNFYWEKENLSAWKKRNRYTNIEEYLNIPSVENLNNCS